jgi:hypothetical protein
MTEENPLEELKHEPTTPLIEKQEEKAVSGESGEVATEKKDDKSHISRRIGELKREAREAKEALEAERQRRIQLEEATKLKKEPDPNDYADYEKLEADKAIWRSQEKARIKQEIQQEFIAEQQEKAQREQAAKVSQEWAKQREKGAKDFDNWYEHEEDVASVVRTTGAWNIRDVILESDNGAAIVNYLGKNPKVLKEISNLPPSAQTRRLIRIETDLEAKPRKTISSAPDPVNTVKGSASVSANPANESMADYIRRKNGFK